MTKQSENISQAQAQQIWLQAQKLNSPSPFGKGVNAVRSAIEHLGYVQIDTIHVIERCHHHILFNRIPNYQRRDLQLAQTKDKSVFEYWTHALAYVPTRDFRFYMPEMKELAATPRQWLGNVKKEEIQKVFRLIKKNGAISIRDISDDVLVDKTHPWDSRKPSKRALQYGFYSGRLVISERVGMLKKYDLTDRHFQWDTDKNPKPKAASAKEINNYILDRALRSQGLVSLDSVCHLDAQRKPEILALIEARIKKKELIPVALHGAEKILHWMNPASLKKLQPEQEITQILSPFDPLVIQRKRLKLFFDYEHRFEAYLPKEKRQFGYFALPILLDDQMVAAIDLKTDRKINKLIIQKWTWLDKHKSNTNKLRIEEKLHAFEKFQCARSEHQDVV